MKRLLLVSYYFPPLAGSGVFRPLRLSKYLPRFGWQVTVLSVSARARVLKDPSLVAEIPPGCRVLRSTSLEPRTAMIALNKLGLRRLAARIQAFFMVPDDQIGWVPLARLRGARLLEREPHDAMVTTAGPYSAHLVGLGLHRKTGIPWVADFRDEWTTNPYLRDRYPTSWHCRMNRRQERRVLEQAQRVVCVSRPWLDAIRELTPDADEDKFRVLPNGYDAEHFPDRPAPPPDRFRIVYTGMFYGHRSPAFFLEGVRRALDSGRIPAGDLEILLVGHTGFADAASLGGLPPGVVRVMEQRPYFEALELLQTAALLLLVIPREGGAGNHTGKLFPYLASGRPILALAPEPNVAAELIRESRSGRVVAPDDPASIASALQELHASWKRGESLADQDRELIARHEASRQARDWARMLDELIRQPLR